MKEESHDSRGFPLIYFKKNCKETNPAGPVMEGLFALLTIKISCILPSVTGVIREVSIANFGFVFERVLRAPDQIDHIPEVLRLPKAALFNWVRNPETIKLPIERGPFR